VTYQIVKVNNISFRSGGNPAGGQVAKGRLGDLRLPI